MGLKSIQKALVKYYDAGYDTDSDASGLTRARRALHHKYGFSTYERGQIELSTPWVSTTNAIPALYWMLCYVVSDPQLLENLRNEVMNAITATGEGADRTLTFNINKSILTTVPYFCLHTRNLSV